MLVTKDTIFKVLEENNVKHLKHFTEEEYKMILDNWESGEGEYYDEKIMSTLEKIQPQKSNLNQMTDRGLSGELIHFNSIYVVVSGSKITPTPKVQCFHSERGEETIEDIQYMVDRLIEDGTIILNSVYYNDIVFNFGGNGEDEKGNDILDIYYFTELDESNTPVRTINKNFIKFITRPKKNDMYIVIMNFVSESIDCLDLVNCPDTSNYDEYVEGVLNYSLTNCEWMIMEKKPSFNFLN